MFNIHQIISELAPEIRRIESWLHARPEPSFEEAETTRFIEGVLSSLPGLSRVELGLKTGTVWRLGGGNGPTVALRADIDAICQHESTGRADSSQHEGLMHACGHDVHAAGLLGAAMALSQMRHCLGGDVIFIFQPAEEVLQGAKLLVSRGLFEKAQISMLFGLHNQPALPLGTVGVRQGPLMAGKDDFVLEVVGKGGHGGLPETCVDPVVAACGIVGALQTVVSRNVSPLDSAVLSVCSIHGGTEDNLVVERVRLTGSLRTMRPAVRERALERVRGICSGCAAAYGCHAELTLNTITPPVQNGAEMAAIARRAAAMAVGEGNVLEPEPSMGCEDFAVYSAHAPTFFYFLGSRGKGGAAWHQPNFCCAPGTAELGAKLLLGSVLAAWGK